MSVSKPKVSGVWMAMLLGLALSAMAGCGEGDPGTDGGDPDGGGLLDVVIADGNPYAGTCIDEVFSCFDWQLPCVDTREGKTLIETFDSGAVFEVDGATGLHSAINSKGETCFINRPDPMDPAVTLVDAPSGKYRVRTVTETQSQTIECPDGSTDEAPVTLVPFIAATLSCTTP